MAVGGMERSKQAQRICISVISKDVLGTLGIRDATEGVGAPACDAEPGRPQSNDG